MLWNYWINKCKGKRIMNAESTYLVEKLIWNVYQSGEARFFEWYKDNKKHLKERYDNGTLMKELDINYD